MLILFCLSFSTSAVAELYKYRTRSGEILITTERRNDLELIETIGSSGSTNRASRNKRTPKISEKFPRPEQEWKPPEGVSRHDAFDDIIAEASQAYDVPFGFVKAVIRVESAFQPHAVSHAGAMGLMQLMPRTAASLNVTDPFDPRQNIFGGTKFLRILIDRYHGDINRILAAYNAGDAAVARYDGIPWPQTRGYVASVYRWYQYYEAAAQEKE